MHYLYHFGNRVFLFNQYDCSVHKFWRKHKVTIVFLKMGPKCSLASPGGTPYNGLYQSSAQTCTFFRLQIYEKVGISLVDVSRVCKFYWWVESLWLLLRKFWSHFGIESSITTKEAIFRLSSTWSWHVYTIVRNTRSSCGGPLTWKAQIHDGGHRRVNFYRNLPSSCFVVQYNSLILMI